MRDYKKNGNVNLKSYRELLKWAEQEDYESKLNLILELKNPPRSNIILWIFLVKTFNDSRILDAFNLGQFEDSFPIIFRATFFRGKKSRYLNARVIIAEVLFTHKYPFRFPDIFLNHTNKHENLIKVQILRTLSSTEVVKNLNLERFFQLYKLSNQDSKAIKLQCIEILKILERYKIISNEVSILPEGRKTTIDKLTHLNISRGIELREIFPENMEI